MESAPGRENSKCKGPGVGVSKVCSSKYKQAHVAGKRRDRSGVGRGGQKPTHAGPVGHDRDVGCILSVVETLRAQAEE